MVLLLASKEQMQVLLPLRLLVVLELDDVDGKHLAPEYLGVHGPVVLEDFFGIDESRLPVLLNPNRLPLVLGQRRLARGLVHRPVCLLALFAAILQGSQFACGDQM